MKKMMSLLLVSTLVFTTGALAQGDTTQTLTGRISQVEEQSFLIEDDIWGEVKVNTSEETVFEGKEVPEEEDFVTVVFNGIMATSMPPQVSAQKVRCEMLEGKVTAISEDGKNIMIENKDQGSFIVFLPEEAIQIPAIGSFVVLYFSGAMTMSLPPQIHAQLINSFAEVTGTVEEVTEDYILIKQDDGQELRVNTHKDHTKGTLEVAKGDEIQVLHDGRMLRSIPAQVFGQRIMKIEKEIE